MTLDAAKWNSTGGEHTSCVINTSIRSCIIIFGIHLPVDFLSFFVLCTYIYMFMFLMFCDLHT